MGDRAGDDNPTRVDVLRPGQSPSRRDARASDVAATSPLGETRRSAAELRETAVADISLDSTQLKVDAGQRGAGPDDITGDDPLGRGATIGRLLILRPLGAGGMGVVYVAYDPELDRKVALKILRHPARADDTTQARLHREAQALAKLAHPNVVAVHDVGTHGGHVWISMEFITGETLTSWLARARPDWQQVLEVMKQAARGVAAAHSAGLLHRDLKPDNIMVGEDGRVRVMDFGLARAGGEREEREDPRDLLTSGNDVLSVELTAAGAIMGTPAYMAPEQFLGVAADERTDQFSLCATLWEALYGERAFAGDTFKTLQRAVTRGERRPPPTRAGVPRWLRRVVERGLEVNRDARHPSVEALLRALETDPTPRRRRRTLGLVAALAVAGYGGLRYAQRERTVAACEGEGEGVSAIWSDDARAQLQERMLATGASYAEETATLVTRALDQHVAAWTEARVEACLDGELRGVWEPETLARARWCLDDRRMELAHLVEELRGVERASLHRATHAVSTLSRVSACRDAPRLSLMPPLPDDVAAVQEVRRQLARAHARAAAGAPEDGLRVAEEARAAAEALGWSPLIAAANWRVGQLLVDAEEEKAAPAALETAYFGAATVGAHEVAANAAVLLVYSVGYSASRFDEGLLWSRNAEVELARLGAGAGDPARVKLLNNLGLLYDARGEFDRARELLLEALELHERFAPADDPYAAGILNNIAIAHAKHGEYDRAKTYFERSIELHERAYGSHHPDLSSRLSNLANIHKISGDFEGSRLLDERSLALAEAAFGSDAPALAAPLLGLAEVSDRLGRYDEAVARYHRVLAIWTSALGPDHPKIALVLTSLATALRNRGDLELALKHSERALAIREGALGPEHPKVAFSLVSFADALTETGELERARPLYERALANFEKAQGPDHLNVAVTLENFAVSRERAGAYDEARALYERALAIKERALGLEHQKVTGSVNGLGRLQLRAGDLTRARALHERALAIVERSLGAEHLKVVPALLGLAEVALADGRPAAAVPLAERALRVETDRDAAAIAQAQAQFVLARALWSAPDGQGRDRARARALTDSASASYRETGSLAHARPEFERFVAKLGR